MGIINRDTDYAVRALCCMAGRGERIVPVTELVKALKIPRPFLRKILQRLNKRRLLASFKGHGGGFMINADPDRIFLIDLIRIFQGRFSLNECVFKKEICPNKKTCLLKKKMDGIEKLVLAELKTITIGSLLKGRIPHGKTQDNQNR